MLKEELLEYLKVLFIVDTYISLILYFLSIRLKGEYLNRLLQSRTKVNLSKPFENARLSISEPSGEQLRQRSLKDHGQKTIRRPAP